MTNIAQRESARHFAACAMAVVLASLSAACTSTGGLEAGAKITGAPATTSVRTPAVGQQWVYQVRNLYNRLIIDEVTETVTATSPVVRIQRVSRKSGALADEIHASWGMIIQDSHWDYPITFSEPLPAWPLAFDLGRDATYEDRYQMVAEPNYSAHWSLMITPRDWESMSVPAGEFTVLRYENLIHYTNDDPSVVSSERKETVWFAPQVGRWVQRRSHGTEYFPGRGGDFHEDYLQWELKSWR